MMTSAPIPAFCIDFKELHRVAIYFHVGKADGEGPPM